MKLEKVNWIFDRMSDQKFLLCYNGPISQELVKSLLSVAEKKLDSEAMDLQVKKKVFNVMMECLQSICKGENNKTEDSFFMLGKSEMCYDVYSCFFVSESYCNELEQFINEINEWGNERLRAEHRNILSNVSERLNEYSLLPFIDIALKSKNKIQYEYKKINENYFFTLKTSIIHKPLSYGIQ